MSALMIALVQVKDPAKLQAYSAAAGPTILAAGGQVLGRGKRVATLCGAVSPDATLIARFPSAGAARSWYDSAAYQALIPLRDEAMVASFYVVEEPA